MCWHSRDKYWFLPKGRRNASEDAGRAAEREGFEEVRVPIFMLSVYVFTSLAVQFVVCLMRLAVKWVQPSMAGSFPPFFYRSVHPIPSLLEQE